MSIGGIEAFGIFTGAFGLFTFGLDKLPKDPPPGGTKVAIKIGDPGADKADESTDGDIANIYAWNHDNKYQGKASGSYIDKGGFEEFTIDAKVAGAQSGYIGVSADKDAACIAWITVTQRDDFEEGAGRWTGDIGKECGHQWHYNSEIAGSKDGKAYRPFCNWLDADHSGTLESAALKFNVLAYGLETNITYDEGKVCDYTTWGPDNGPINRAPGKRSLKPRSQKIKDILIVSDINDQSAEELCTSETSWGWDFIGPDGKYCDMETHTMLPLCSHEEVDGCISLEENEETGTKRLTRRSLIKRSDGFLEATDRVTKEYSHITHW